MSSNNNNTMILHRSAACLQMWHEVHNLSRLYINRATYSHCQLVWNMKLVLKSDFIITKMAFRLNEHLEGSQLLLLIRRRKKRGQCFEVLSAFKQLKKNMPIWTSKLVVKSSNVKEDPCNVFLIWIKTSAK